MNFTFTEEQRLFAETARSLLSDTCQPADLRRLLAEGGARDAARWGAIIETGLTLLLLPEAAGGLGLTETDFALIAEAAGYYALPEPLVESAGVAAPMLAAIFPGAPVLQNPAATLAIQHPINPFVTDADTAEALLLHHQGETHLVDRQAAKLTREPSIDPFRRLFRVDWTPAPATRIAEGSALWSAALDRGALFAAAQGLGLAQRAIDLAADYAKARTQFGKPIGAYQAIKHHLASAQVKLEFARPVVQAAAAVSADGDAYSRARVSHAKIVALEAADFACRTAVQVHGAMGYSWEVDVHLFLKRTLALTFAWGTPAFHRARVAHRVFDLPTGPDQTFAREPTHA
jgi:alkylation response protein AidB-like acyl-CoA dehydrogenase